MASFTKKGELAPTVAMSARVGVQDLAQAALYLEKIGVHIEGRSSLVGMICKAVANLPEEIVPRPTLEEAWEYLDKRWPPIKDPYRLAREKQIGGERLTGAFLGRVGERRGEDSWGRKDALAEVFEQAKRGQEETEGEGAFEQIVRVVEEKRLSPTSKQAKIESLQAVIGMLEGAGHTREEDKDLANLYGELESLVGSHAAGE